MAASTPGPTVSLSLQWRNGLVFDVSAGPLRFVSDSAGALGPSPVTMLVAALASCMAMDVAHVLGKSRAAFQGLTVDVAATRSPTDPKRVLTARLHFAVKGEVPPDRVRHAISLSRETYCSVWHSLREDIVLTTTFDVNGQADTSAGTSPSR